jgi:hypothetical protein
MVFYSTIPFGVLAIVFGCLIRDPSQYRTNHTATHMEREGMFDESPHQQPAVLDYKPSAEHAETRRATLPEKVV